MRILIVDDHEINLKLLRVQLEAEGHEVAEAENGEEALELLDREMFDGVVSDILMPRVDGYRLCLEIRNDPRHHALPVVLYTSTYNSPTDRKLARDAGADAFISKPSPTAIILDALVSARGRTRPSPGGAALAAPVMKQYNEALVRKLETKSLELEQAHDELVQIEARLSGMVASASDAIIAIDSRHRVCLFNPAAGRLFQCRPADALGRLLDDFIPQRFRAKHGAQIEAFGRDHSAVRLVAAREVWALRTDGTEFPIEATISKLDTKQQGRLYTVFIRDITERHQARQALMRSEAALRRAQSLAKLAHVITGPEGEFVSWSASLPDLIGLDEAKMPRSTRQWLELIHPEDQELFRQGLIVSANAGQRGEMEFRIRRGQDWLDLRQDMEPLPESDGFGQDGLWFSTLQDVSEQKQAERKIRSLNRVHAVLSGINSLIVRVRDRDELFRDACHVAVEKGEFARASIGLVDAEKRIVRLIAWSGAPDSFFATRQAHLTADTIDGEGPVARAVTSGLPVTLNDVDREGSVLEKAQISRGTASIAVLPLPVSGKVVGVLILSAKRPGFFNSEEMQLLQELAGDIAFAMDHLSQTERIHYLANFDALTGLPNRALFLERLAHRLETADGEMLALMLINLERFRRVNLTLGRVGGDTLLCQVGERLKQENASVARIGGDLFALMIDGAHSLADFARAREDIAKRCFGAPFTLAGNELRIGYRGGIAVFPGDGTDAESLLRNAEAALRRAKAAVTPFLFYTPEMNARAANALVIESRLRRAIEKDEFVLHYQPKVALGSERIAGLEALIRWQDPDKGLVPPVEFVPILEETGLIGIVGQWALRQGMADYRRWKEMGLMPPRVAVNVSPMQLHEVDFAARIGQVIADQGGGALELEITESLIMDNVEANIAVLGEIREQGVSIAVDDFGTGYCSLSYIAKLPVTALKIDRAFILGMTEGPEGMAIVSSIIALAHALRLKVVAEGVETEEQARLLRLLGCDEVQGYLYSRPLPAAGIDDLLRVGILRPSKVPH